MRLAELYTRQPIPLDSLPYTVQFERIVAEFNLCRVEPLSHNRVWLGLMAARKAGILPRKVKL